MEVSGDGAGGSEGDSDDGRGGGGYGGDSGGGREGVRVMVVMG